MVFLVIFIFLPIMELIVFAAISDEIGFLAALLLLVLSAMLGGAVIQRQGFENAQDARSAVQKGVLPIPALFDRLCLFLAGILLIVPGFLTDITGLLLLAPAARDFLRVAIKNYMDVRTTRTGFSSGYPGEQDVIEAEFENITKQTDDKS